MHFIQSEVLYKVKSIFKALPEQSGFGNDLFFKSKMNENGKQKKIKFSQNALLAFENKITENR